MITKTKPLPLIIPRLIIGLIFLSEGLQKFIVPEAVGVGRFTKIEYRQYEF